MPKKKKKSASSLRFGSLVELKEMVKTLNEAGKAQYRLIKQNPKFYLLEQDLGDEFLDYFILEVREGKVWAVSEDVMEFLQELKKKLS